MALIRKLHGSVDCFATQRVMASLFEHQLEFQFVPVDLKAANNPYLLSLNPFGEIPVFEDGDVTLFESTAAMRYISHEYATQAIQQVYMTPLMQGVVATWIDVENHQFREPAVRLIEAIRSGNEAAAEVEERRLGRVLDVYEERLTASEFLGGDKFTAADLTHVPYLHALMQSARGKRFLLEGRPHVASWCVGVLSRTSWARVQQMVATYSIV
ncbi:hypothetical protein V2J09_015539 [Rumex salicifolius]